MLRLFKSFDTISSKNLGSICKYTSTKHCKFGPKSCKCFRESYYNGEDLRPAIFELYKIVCDMKLWNDIKIQSKFKKSNNTIKKILSNGYIYDLKFILSLAHIKNIANVGWKKYKKYKNNISE